jgi:protein arginine N-methyltransferase 5
MLSIGIDFCNSDVEYLKLKEILDNSAADFICLDLVSLEKNGKYRIRSDLELPSQAWRTQIASKFNGLIIEDLESFDDNIRKKAECLWEKHCAWTVHLGSAALWIDVVGGIPKTPSGSFGRAVYNAIIRHKSLVIWISIDWNKWEMWADIVAMTGYSANVRVVVDLSETETFYSAEDRAKLISKRWGTEFLAGIVVSEKQYQDDFEVLQTMLPFSNLFIIRTDRSYEEVKRRSEKNEKFMEKEVQLVHSMFLKHAEHQAKLDQQECVYNLELSRLCKQYYTNVLQTPLQPLHDNLESQIYEIFEKDIPKYKLYQSAITTALKKLSNSSNATEHLRILVIGAGRGPLITATLQAASTLGIINNCQIYAIEKNPCALITLEHLNHDIWHDSITLIHTDIRNWHQFPQLSCLTGKFDLIISELLGSFGDNELSPECIQSAWPLLRHPTGLCIPQQYTSYLSPISNASIWHSASSQSALEQPHVVRIDPYFSPTTLIPQPCFTFSSSPSSDHSRFTTLYFPIDISCTIDGLHGSFSSQLFEDVHLSTVPDSSTPGLLSWFPIFFPLRSPLCVSRGEILQVQIWRVCERTRVWYEWNVGIQSKTPQRVHNAHGQYYSLRLD